MSPLALLLLIMPAASVLQFRAIAPLAIAALLATIIMGWRAERRVPWPSGTVLWAALALAGWGAISAAWAVDPRRAAVEALLLGAFFALGAAAAGVVARSDAGARRGLLRCLAIGLAGGVALAALDHVTGNAVRAAVRGLLAALAVAVALWLPAETAKIAILAGLLAYGLAWLLPRFTRVAIAGALAIAILGMPVILGAVLARAPAGMLPFSAAHRVVIWDFAMGRIAEHPLRGWGFEASRAIPGGKANATPTTLDRLGITDATQRARFALPNAESLPLHPHNAPLQLHLELGMIGAALAALLVALLALRARTPSAVGAMVAAAVVGSLSYGLWQGWWIALLLVVVAATRAIPCVAATRALSGEGREDIA